MTIDPTEWKRWCPCCCQTGKSEFDRGGRRRSEEGDVAKNTGVSSVGMVRNECYGAMTCRCMQMGISVGVCKQFILVHVNLKGSTLV
mmetsp:Transcript_30679/g.42870  ORF Transcript_30679/g.42870 Transcript_30679/m.42870 type:complete len:87 (-) Transcript_30679:143-403(-)